MKPLGYVEERLRPEHDAPLSLQPHVTHKGNQRIKDLCHATAKTGGVDVQDPGTVQSAPKILHLVVEVPAYDASVVGKRFIAGVYSL